MKGIRGSSGYQFASLAPAYAQGGIGHNPNTTLIIAQTPDGETKLFRVRKTTANRLERCSQSSDEQNS